MRTTVMCFQTSFYAYIFLFGKKKIILWFMSQSAFSTPMTVCFMCPCVDVLYRLTENCQSVFYSYYKQCCDKHLLVAKYLCTSLIIYGFYILTSKRIAWYSSIYFKSTHGSWCCDICITCTWSSVWQASFL